MGSTGTEASGAEDKGWEGLLLPGSSSLLQIRVCDSKFQSTCLKPVIKTAVCFHHAPSFVQTQNDINPSLLHSVRSYDRILPKYSNIQH